MNVEKYARVQFKNFIGANIVNIEESSSEFTAYRSGASVYLNSSAGTRIEIAATQTSQTIRFADGSSELVIKNGNVMLGSQIVSTVQNAVQAPLNISDNSKSIF
ncbi:MAG: hypothetical protein HQK65_14180 [Desulfamplus sp.]|nr:hypothetical protein [Desulfamplus sp.]